MPASLTLAASNDKFQLVTDVACDVDVYASLMDYTTVVAPVAPQVTTITTATTTDIVAAPAASTTRAVEFLNIRNVHASTAVTVTFLFNRSATTYELYKATLAAGDTLEYQEGIGWFVISSVGKLDAKLRVATDVINATTSFADITGLTCPVKNGKQYNFHGVLWHIENAATTGAQFAINGPTVTNLRAWEWGIFAGSITAATSQANLADVTTRDAAMLVATSSQTTPGIVPCFIMGWINPSADGTFAVRCASEVAVAAGITVKAGSWCRIWESDS